MKKFTLPAIFLTFMATSYSSYSSAMLEETELKSFKRPPALCPNRMTPAGTEKKHELKLLKTGLAAFLNGKEEEALAFFKKAVGAYGSPLGYLYAGVLSDDEATSERYLHIAHLAVRDEALSQGVLDQHIQYLIQEGFLSKS